MILIIYCLLAESDLDILQDLNRGKYLLDTKNQKIILIQY